MLKWKGEILAAKRSAAKKRRFKTTLRNDRERTAARCNFPFCFTRRASTTSKMHVVIPPMERDFMRTAVSCTFKWRWKCCSESPRLLASCAIECKISPCSRYSDIPTKCTSLLVRRRRPAQPLLTNCKYCRFPPKVDSRDSAGKNRSDSAGQV